MINHLNQSGHLDVGDGHQIYWEDWGNSEAPPIFHLHGGPGSNFTESHKEIYNPKKHHVIFHDQRGCGKSRPFASTDNNTTEDLLEDIDKLREHLGYERVYVAGGSWGSTLALLYTIRRPELVKKLMIWSVFLATDEETEYVNSGGPKLTFPEAWERFIDIVPESERKTGDSILKYYAAAMRRNDESAKRYAFEWTLWEASLISISYYPEKILEELKVDPSYLSVALLETHYFINKCFVPENYILDNIKKIKEIPCYISHGRFDMCTPPSSAYKLKKAYGAKAKLTWITSGHVRSDPEMLHNLQSTALKELI